MAREINLTIALPGKVYLEEKVSSVVVPALKAAVNVLPDRAPSVFVLDYGALDILDEMGKLQKRYFVMAGVAEVAENNCKVMVQGIVPFENMDAKKAQTLVEDAQNAQDRLFYQMISNYYNGVSKCYLQNVQTVSES